MSIADAKKALRKDALERRKTIDAPGAAERARDLLLKHVPLPPAAAVSGYVAMKGELDPLPALQALEGQGYTILLPYTVTLSEPLRFLAAPGGVATGHDAFGIPAPPESAPAHDPEVLIVPLAAFDRRGYRLGYGGGFFDATLTRLRGEGRILAIGWAYAAQEVAEVPIEPHDAQLDWIVTEREAIYISR